MIEGGRIEIFEPGLYTLPDHSLHDDARERRPLDVGSTISVQDASQSIYAAPRTELLVGLQPSGNGLRTTQWHDTSVTHHASPLASPPYEQHVVRDDAFGEVPGGRLTIEYGQPEPAVLVSYLGHPLRDVFESYMGVTDDDAPPKPKGNRFKTEDGSARMLFTGTPVHATIHGLNDGMHNHAYVAKKQEPFESTLMIGAYVVDDRRFKEPQIEVFAAYNTDIDQITRVQRQIAVVSIDPPSEETSRHSSRVVDELAAISVYGRNLGDPAFGDQREDFPIQVVNYWQDELRRRASRFTESLDGWYGELQREQGFDWTQIRNELPKEAVTKERERLTKVLGIDYVPYVSPPKVTQANRRGRPRGTYRVHGAID